ncbi:transketolase family protein [Actinoplanes derwentensis]|uniref:Transketolase subunit B n=1 Tax=Actinoplanes derwentensis TaxID=113562 RepID=A0A1H1UX41_9ACTN|nr:transketolase C-terminal domain-containing protein [Actinoplanes derwentensis]GID88892.1 transketolase, C-terminal subunit [Actinoplanes derwentensis]SDS76656.1 transketolase subunit B [Actinoplanes derwentensis]
MRDRFFAGLLAAALIDPDLVLITADLGFGAVDEFAAVRPGQFLNAGVAEQNMAGLAAGIALAGGRVFTYSIANFPTLRCLEQIRNDICYHHADVTVVAVGGGMAYGALGMSHHATEDLAIMRALPGMAVAAPGDPAEVGAVLTDLLAGGGPAYLRLGKTGERTVHAHPVDAPRGASIPLSHGGEVLLCSTGAILGNVCQAAELLESDGIRADVRSFPWLDPLDTLPIREAADAYSVIVTVEEHSIVGGLGSAIAEVLAETATGTPLVRIALPAQSMSVVGDQDYLRGAYELDPESIRRRVRNHLEAHRGLASQIR